MRKSFISVLHLLTLCVSLNGALLHANSMVESCDEVTIIGGGIAGALHAHHVYCESVKNEKPVRITICEKNKSIADTTTANIVLSLTPDEIIAVIPRNKEMMRLLQVTFNESRDLSSEGIIFKDMHTTTANIVPSLTPDEMLSVVPFGATLYEKLKTPFNQPGGIRIDDVAGVNDSEISKRFIDQVEKNSNDILGYQDRTKTLLALGKLVVTHKHQMNI